MAEWDEIDEAAMREGFAIKRANGHRVKGPRKPRSVDKNDIIKQSKRNDKITKAFEQARKH